MYGLGFNLTSRAIIQFLINLSRLKDGKNVLDLTFELMFLSWFAAYVNTVVVMME